jgi:sigma-B regulation protein RsbU (phosphoserine phosphatase)
MNPAEQASPDPYRGLLRVSCVINSIRDYRELLTSLLQITKEVMDCNAASLYSYQPETNDLVWHVALGDKADKLKEVGRLKMGQGVAGWVAENQKSALVADTATDSRFFRGADTTTGFVTRSIVCVPLLVGNKLVGVLQALNPSHKKSFDERDMEVFEAYGALAATAIEKIRWQEAMLTQQKHEQELEIAKEIQDRFLSKRFINAETILQMAFFYKSAFQIGGDFYDVQEVHGDRYAILVGDVSGKGVPAALLMAQILSEFRHFAYNEPNPGIILSHLNECLITQSTRGMFATAWCAVVRPSEKGLDTSHANAGHHPPIHFSSEHAQPVKLDAGLPLGIMPEIHYGVVNLPLARGHGLCAYSDGVTESRDVNGVEFGQARLEEILKKGGPDLTSIRDQLAQTAQHYYEGTAQRDDITFFLLSSR